MKSTLRFCSLFLWTSLETEESFVANMFDRKKSRSPGQEGHCSYLVGGRIKGCEFLLKYFLCTIGAVHEVCHAIFDQFWHLLPCHTLSHISGPPKVCHTSQIPQFIVVQRNGLKLPVQNLSQWFTRFLFRGFVRGFLSGRFCLGWVLFVPLLSEYLRYCRKLNITFTFRFHMYVTKI